MERVAIRQLKHHPNNPRIGNVEAIAESLEVHGQYRPIVANRQTGHIVAGNHTVKAARGLGWKHVNVTWVDVDSKTELAMLLADNRLADLATYDEPLLIDLLQSMPDLSGTGWTQDAVDELLRTQDLEFDGDGDKTQSDFEQDDEAPTLKIGKHQADIDRFEYDRWRALEMELGKKKDVIASLRLRLDIPLVIRDSVPRGTEHQDRVKHDGAVPIDRLTPHPYNPREGDIGAISQSLQQFGQYRTVVATTDGIILAGHHVVKAAQALGWTHIAVTFIDVNETEATKILLADNRTSDLGTYNDDALRQAVLTITDTPSTGWTPEDIQNLLEGKPHRQRPPTGKVRCNIGEFSWTDPRSTIDTWQNTVTLPNIADRIGLPESALTETS
jgi:ParB-like chromosome segregation protein Spo0J